MYHFRTACLITNGYFENTITVLRSIKLPFFDVIMSYLLIVRENLWGENKTFQSPVVPEYSSSAGNKTPVFARVRVRVGRRPAPLADYTSPDVHPFGSP